MNDFLGKPCPSRPADSLRCLPVSAVRPILYSSLQSDHTKFLYFVSFCFFRRADSGCLISLRSNNFLIVPVMQGAACPLHPSPS